MDDVSRHVLFLTDLITYPVTPSVPIRRSTSSRISDPPGAQHGHNNIYEMEVQRLTFVAIGSLVDQARHLVSDETWNMTIQVSFATLALLLTASNFFQSFHFIIIHCVDCWWVWAHMQALRVILETVASKKTLVEDYAASRLVVRLIAAYCFGSNGDQCGTFAVHSHTFDLWIMIFSSRLGWRKPKQRKILKTILWCICKINKYNKSF